VTGGRSWRHKVVSFAHGSIGVGGKGPLLTLKVSITDRNRSRGMKIASSRYRGFSCSQGATPTETGIEIRTGRIGALDGLIGGPDSAWNAAAGHWILPPPPNSLIRKSRKPIDRYVRTALKGTAVKTNLRFSGRLFNNTHLQTAALSHGRCWLLLLGAEKRPHHAFERGAAWRPSPSRLSSLSAVAR
jgi:hypothetical protein